MAYSTIEFYEQTINLFLGMHKTENPDTETKHIEWYAFIGILLFIGSFVILQLQFPNALQSQWGRKRHHEVKNIWRKRYLFCICTCKTAEIVTKSNCTLLFTELILVRVHFIHSKHLCRWIFIAFHPSLSNFWLTGSDDSYFPFTIWCLSHFCSVLVQILFGWVWMFSGVNCKLISRLWWLGHTKYRSIDRLTVFYCRELLKLWHKTPHTYTFSYINK